MKLKISVNSGTPLLKTPNLLPPKRDFETKEIKNSIKIRYKRKCRGGSNSEWLSVPEVIKITPELTKALGIYYAEGDKSDKRWHTRFSNSDISVILEGMNLFNALGLGKHQIKGYIKTYNLSISDEELIKYWSENTGIPKENFIKIARYVSKNKYERKRKPPSAHGRIEVYYSSVVLRDIIDNLLKTVKYLSLRNREIGVNFLKGLISGEGSVKLHKNKLRELRIASCDKKEQMFIRKLLKFLNIEPSNASYKFYIAISGSQNLKKMKDIDAFQIHPEKRKLFDSGFNNFLTSGE
jgi:hypothetical protein